MTVRAKFKCKSVGQEFGYVTKDGKTSPGLLVHWIFTPVYDPDPNSENGRFFASTPTGEFRLGVSALPAETFEPGKEYYLDITPAN